MSAAPPPQFTIRHVRTPKDAAAIRDAFAVAYCDVFSGEPYNELFTLDEAAGVFDQLIATRRNITLVALAPTGEVAAFGVAVPMESRPDIARYLRGLVPVEHTYYLTELGVVPAHRGYGVGRALVRERILHMDLDHCTHVVLRVSASDEDRSKRMYAGMGFEDMGVYMDVPAMRTDGSFRTDRRLFLSRVLSQVDLE